MAHSSEKPNDTAPSIETTPEYHRAVTLLVDQVLAMGEYNRGERHDQPALSILLERGRRTTALETTVLAGRTTEHPENIKQELEALVMMGVASASEESDEVVYAANRSVSISRPPRLDDRKLSVAELIDESLAAEDILTAAGVLRRQSEPQSVGITMPDDLGGDWIIVRLETPRRSLLTD